MGSTPRLRRGGGTALVSLILGSSAPPAGVDAFYEPPSALPPGAAGDVLRAEPATVALIPGCPLPATDAWRLMYRSTSAIGEPVAVTATLMVPRAPWPPVRGPRPLVSLAVGGHGLGRGCAPSLQFGRGTQFEMAVIVAHLAQGWAVVVTDYQRTPTCPYLNAAASAHAVLDAARAAGRVPGAGVPPGGPVGITGYGHGGTAAAAAAERHPWYAPDLDVRGVAAGGVAADLPAVLRSLERGPLFGLVPAVLAGLLATYPDLALGALPAAGRRAVRAAARRCLPDVLDQWAGRASADLTGGPPIAGILDADPAWRARLDEQRIGRLVPAVPVLVFHGLGDPCVPYDVTWRLVDGWRSRGADARLAAHPVVVHKAALVEAVPQVHRWLGGRLCGERGSGGTATSPHRYRSR